MRGLTDGEIEGILGDFTGIRAPTFEEELPSLAEFIRGRAGTAPNAHDVTLPAAAVRRAAAWLDMLARLYEERDRG